MVFDIQQLIPLPEAGDLMVKKRQKDAQQKAARTRGGAASVRYSVNVNGEQTTELERSKAILAVVTELHQRGISPVAMRGTIAQNRQRFYEVEGNFEAENEFIEAAAFAADRNGGKAFSAKVYFTDDEQLFHHGGKTYAFSNQWGPRTESRMKALIDAHGEGRISFEREA